MEDDHRMDTLDCGEEISRRVSGEALEESLQLLSLLREARPELDDAQRLALITKAFGWTSTARLALMAAFVACREEAGA